MPEVRLIDANALIDKLDIMISKSLLADTAVHYALIRELVAEQPAIEAEPIRHGRWIVTDDCEKFTAKCSVCGRIEDSRLIADYPYCHCGARMDGGAENG